MSVFTDWTLSLYQVNTVIVTCSRCHFPFHEIWCHHLHSPSEAEKKSAVIKNVKTAAYSRTPKWARRLFTLLSLRFERCICVLVIGSGNILLSIKHSVRSADQSDSQSRDCNWKLQAHAWPSGQVPGGQVLPWLLFCILALRNIDRGYDERMMSGCGSLRRGPSPRGVTRHCRGWLKTKAPNRHL